MAGLIEINDKSIRQSIERIKEQYSHVSGDILNQAISRALNRTAQQGRTIANKNIRKIYNISAAKINNEIKVSYSTARTLESKIRASGAPLGMNNFQAKQEKSLSTTGFNRKGVASTRLNRRARTNAVKGVTMTIKKGKSVNLPTAFIQVANGGITVFARGKYKGTSEGMEFAKERLPIAKITTLSIPMMFANDEVLKPLSTELMSIFDSRITHEINYLLNK